MTMKFFRFLRSLYEPVLVLLLVGAAGLIVYELCHAQGGGRGHSICFDAAFDDVSGIKQGSSVLFKGMPVGTVGVMKYDPGTDKILVRINIKKPRDIPANIKPYVESSLMGQSSIALLTETTGAAAQLLADAVSEHQAKNRETTSSVQCSVSSRPVIPSRPERDSSERRNVRLRGRKPGASGGDPARSGSLAQRLGQFRRAVGEHLAGRPQGHALRRVLHFAA